MPSHHPLSPMPKNDCAFTLTKLFSERFSLGILLKPRNDALEYERQRRKATAVMIIEQP